MCWICCNINDYNDTLSQTCCNVNGYNDKNKKDFKNFQKEEKYLKSYY